MFSNKAHRMHMPQLKKSYSSPPHGLLAAAASHRAASLAGVLRDARSCCRSLTPSWPPASWRACAPHRPAAMSQRGWQGATTLVGQQQGVAARCTSRARHHLAAACAAPPSGTHLVGFDVLLLRSPLGGRCLALGGRLLGGLQAGGGPHACHMGACHTHGLSCRRSL